MKAFTKYFSLFIFLLGLYFGEVSCNISTSKNAQSFNEDSIVKSDDAWKKRAREMVNTQIIARNVNDKRVIEVMMNIPRHLFVPDNMQNHAYKDGPLPIGEEQTISQPYIVALMTELLQLKGHEKVLEIGTGSGYQAAVLSHLVDTCYSIELIKNLADRASKLLNELKMHNVIVKCGDGYQGWPAHAPFDRIIVTAAPEVIPPKLIEQLKLGGRMVIPVGKYYQELMVITKDDNGKIIKESITPVRFVPMVHPRKEY
ncbi:MAG: protein-L-isoaspartate O-methyltransferase [Bacteroidetes bacterium]|nr:MAG: protein-L-isoaspartate O-methyltransferase [Bacteroidota bacterium]